MASKRLASELPAHPVHGPAEAKRRKQLSDWSGAKPWQERSVDETVSRFLCKILRHDAASVGLQLRSDGYVPLSEVLALDFFATRSIGEADVERMVKSNEKQRFGLGIPEGETELHIRAHQGHSLRQVDDAALLEDVHDPKDLKVLCHGTFWDHLESIKKQGLKSFGRNHIHCVTLDLTCDKHRQSVINGSRGECDVVIFINAKAAMESGVTFHRSTNNVILTRGQNGILPAKFFEKVAVWNYDTLGWDYSP